MENIYQQILHYVPVNQQEEKDRSFLLNVLENEKDLFVRENERMHFTASAWVSNRAHDKVILAYHNIYDTYAWLGGHADGEEDLLSVALKEAKEECGIKDIKVLTPQIASLEVLAVEGHFKKGKYVNSHLHLNVTYLFETSEEEILRIKEDENSAVDWFFLEDVYKVSKEKWYNDNIYSKLNEKLKSL